VSVRTSAQGMAEWHQPPGRPRAGGTGDPAEQPAEELSRWMGAPTPSSCWAWSCGRPHRTRARAPSSALL